MTEIRATKITSLGTLRDLLGEPTTPTTTDDGGPCRDRSHSPRLRAGEWFCLDCNNTQGDSA